MTATIESLDNEILPSVVRQMFSNMTQLHCSDILDPKIISSQMKNLKSGSMMGIYVREQNCGLFIHMANDDEATISTFQASLPNEMIYGGSINGDIQVREYLSNSGYTYFWLKFDFLGWLSDASDQSQTIDNAEIGGIRRTDSTFEQQTNEPCHV